LRGNLSLIFVAGNQNPYFMVVSPAKENNLIEAPLKEEMYNRR
jgi:hypothetical protein